MPVLRDTGKDAHPISPCLGVKAHSIACADIAGRVTASPAGWVGGLTVIAGQSYDVWCQVQGNPEAPEEARRDMAGAPG